ncbi:MAG: hypothetical protein ACJ8G8_23125 [Pseudomonas sp.]
MKIDGHKAGELDSTFGDSGAAYFSDAYYLFGMTTDSNESIYVAGVTRDDKFYLARATRDGKLDTNFGGIGYVIGTFLDDHKSQASTVSIDQQDRVLITGRVYGSGDKIGVARFTPDGNLDETFADKGRAAIPPPSESFTTEPPQTARESSQSSAAMVLSDGTIMVFQKLGLAPYLVRLTENGKLDQTFNGTGYVKVFYEDYDLLPSSKSVIEGERLIIGATIFTHPLNYGLLAGYNLNGQLDRTFAEDGYALLREPADLGSEIWNLQQAQGDKIWAIGRTTPPGIGSGLPPSRGLLTRLSKDGHIDVTFNQGQPVLTPPGFDDEWIAGVLQNDGKVVLAGSQFAAPAGGKLGRYHPDGRPDKGFGENGIRFLPSKGSARLVTLQKDGRILIGGAVSPEGYSVAAILRYHN